MHVVQNQMLAAGSLKISFITMSQFSTTLYEFDIPEFFLRPLYFFSGGLEVSHFSCTAKEKCMFDKESERIYAILGQNFNDERI